MPLVISPLIVPVVITAVGSYLFYARVGLASTYVGIILAHTALASPFVVVTVGASLTGFDRNLMRAASIAGAKPIVAFLQGNAAADPARRPVRSSFRLRHVLR